MKKTTPPQSPFPFYPERYEELFVEKHRDVQQMVARFAAVDVEAFRSCPRHYRQRAEFRVWFEQDEFFYVMFAHSKESARPQPVRIDHFDVACEPIAKLMPRLLDELKKAEVLWRRLFHVEFLATLSGDMLVVLAYHKPVDALWEEAARELAHSLGIGLIGRSRKKRIVINRDFVTERLQVGSDVLTYFQYENSFTQPNARVCQKMIGWAQQCFSQYSANVLFEMYCGHGTFTIALAPLFKRVIATEISKRSIEACRQNCKANAILNIDVRRLSAQECVDAFAGRSQTSRARGLFGGPELIDAIFVDPPRCGLEEQICQFASRFKMILYISCNPQTLQRDLQIICKTHSVVKAAFFDQFPYTHHSEVGVLCIKKS